MTRVGHSSMSRPIFFLATPTACHKYHRLLRALLRQDPTNGPRGDHEGEILDSTRQACLGIRGKGEAQHAIKHTKHHPDCWGLNFQLPDPQGMTAVLSCPALLGCLVVEYRELYVALMICMVLKSALYKVEFSRVCECQNHPPLLQAVRCGRQA